MNTGNKIIRMAIMYTKSFDSIVISGFQAKLYPVSFSIDLAKLHKSHRKVNYLASYTWYNTRTESQTSVIYNITFIYLAI